MLEPVRRLPIEAEPIDELCVGQKRFLDYSLWGLRGCDARRKIPTEALAG